MGNVKGQVITTIAGNTTAGFSGDGGQAIASSLNNLSNKIVDNLGNL